jgi:hypothetical protein
MYQKDHQCREDKQVLESWSTQWRCSGRLGGLMLGIFDAGADEDDISAIEKMRQERS